MEELRELYLEYYHSCPTQRWMSKRKHLFKAKPLNEMTDIEMMAGISRDVAEYNLEDYVFNVLVPNGWQWGDKWFYQDEKIKTLILLKEWFE